MRSWPAIAVGCVLVAASATAGERVPRPAIVVDKSTQCVAPADVMRRTHHRMLERQKDRTVRLGIRGEPGNLAGCIECHASKASGSVIGSADAFCQSCHDYVGVRLDCFGCHQPTVKRGKAAARAP